MIGDISRQDHKWGTIEQKDPNGNVMREEYGLIIGRGENKKVVSPKTVEDLAALWCDYKEIAEMVGVNVETLKYNFSDYIIKGRNQTKQGLRKAQLKAAMGGNITMQIWLGKNILGQSDNPATNGGDEPLPWTD